MNTGLDTKFEQLDNSILEATNTPKDWQELSRKLGKIKQIATNEPSEALEQLNTLHFAIIEKFDSNKWKNLEEQIEEIASILKGIQDVTDEVSEKVSSI